MAEGRESVMYALPFCAGTVTGIFLCGHGIFFSGSPYLVAAVSMPAGLAMAVLSFILRGKQAGSMRFPAVIAAIFFCGMFCRASHEITDIATADRGTREMNFVEMWQDLR